MKRQIFTVAMAVAAVFFVLFIWWRADEGGLPAVFTTLYNFPYGDKIGHFLLMGMLTFLVCLPFCAPQKTLRSLSGVEATDTEKHRPSCRGDRQRAQKRLLIIIAAISFVITLEEISQHFFASRTMDAFDLLCSYAGIGFFGGLAMWLCRKRLSNA